MGRGKPATPINKEAFLKAVEEAEKDGTCGTRKALFEAVAGIYNTQNPEEKKINPNHANTRILKTWGTQDLLTGNVLLENGYLLKTNKGSRGRLAGTGAPAGRKGTEVDKKVLFEAVKEAEKEGGLSNRTLLFAAAAENYNAVMDPLNKIRVLAEAKEEHGEDYGKSESEALEIEKTLAKLRINGNTVRTRIVVQGWGDCLDDGTIYLGKGEEAYEIQTQKGRTKRSTPLLSGHSDVDTEEVEGNIAVKPTPITDTIGQSGLTVLQEVFLKAKAKAEGLNEEDYLEKQSVHIFG